VLVVCALGLAAAPVVAQPKVSDAVKARASELVKQAIAKSQAGDHAAAADLYEQAYILVPQPLLLSNLGSEYQKLGKRVEAIRDFCKYIKADPNGPAVEYATSQVKGMQIELGNEPDPDDVCTIKPKPQVTASPNAGAAETPPAPASTAAPAATTVTATAEPPAPAPSRALEYTGAGIGAAGLAAFGVGIYFGLQAKDLSDKITNHDPTQPWPDNIKQMEADGKSDQTKQIAFMIGGGVVAAGGIVIAILGRAHAASAERVSLRPLASPTTIGLAVGGGF
jgi:opacity protein-like surface antigen